MTLTFKCSCGSVLKAADEFAGARCICPYCRRTLALPSPPAARPDRGATDGGSSAAGSSAASSSPASSSPAGSSTSSGSASDGAPSSSAHDSIVDATVIDELLPVQEFFDSPWGAWASQPAAEAAAATTTQAAVNQDPTPRVHWGKRMLLAVLDPQAIQWFLTLGGGLMVLGIIIWLASLGIFKNPYAVAGLMGVGSLALLAGGCAVALRTRFVTAGKALSFLGCVVLPLNLWYYEHQGILSLDGQLWMAAFVICWLYVATVFLLRDSLFLYAVEAGVTLTALLLMASLGRLSDVTYLSLTLVVLALVSIHAERAFPPTAETFSRKRFGMALFWSGHVQLAAGLLLLGVAQIMQEIVKPTGVLLGIQWTGVLLTQSKLLAAGIWLAGTYAYLYSDLAVRRVGVYTYLAAACLMMAGVTLVGVDVASETLILLMTATAVGATVIGRLMPSENDRYRRSLKPTSLILCFLAVGLGCLLHLRATSHALADTTWAHDTGWYFVVTMAIAAAANRFLTYLERGRDAQATATYLFLSAAALIVGAAGLLRNLELREWYHQAPVLMLIPVGYLIASRWRIERDVRGPLQWIAHVATAVIMLSIAIGSFERVGRMLVPISGRTENLLAGLVFAEATLFYALAAWIRRKDLNYYLATVAACAAIWEWIGYGNLPSAYYTLLYAALGVGVLIASRIVGIQDRDVFNVTGQKTTQAMGPGRPLYLIANGLLAVAVVAAILQSLARLLGQESTKQHLLALVLTTCAGGLAVRLSRRGPERWWHATGTVILAGLTFLTFNVLIDLSIWRKAEIFAVGAGLAMLIASYITRFREDKPSELASVGLWLGSLATSLALLGMVFHQGIMVSPVDDMALLTITILMLASGAALQFKAPTLLGGGTLSVYLATVVVNLAYSPQVAIGVYLAVGGFLLFGVGLMLSMYRERLLELPEKMANREGIFKIIGWR